MLNTVNDSATEIWDRSTEYWSGGERRNYRKNVTLDLFQFCIV